MGVQGQYTGYNAPDDNAYIEHFMRTIKEEEIWQSQYDCWSEAHLAIDRYIHNYYYYYYYYYAERIHSALDYRTPIEMEAIVASLKPPNSVLLSGGHYVTPLSRSLVRYPEWRPLRFLLPGSCRQPGVR